ncbi:hypothetical protein BKA70DRAFT_1419272 [Coprinopsis sp. MPI-PUGE-AT-0042]|nr:hypothetical protein BKA70DRAFT_1419272 [Coprinopsis sp. MPI-PUGE-AT-0042]
MAFEDTHMRNMSEGVEQHGSDDEVPMLDFLRIGSRLIPTPTVQPSSPTDGDDDDLSFDFLRGHSVTAADLAFVKEEEVPTDVPIRKASTTFSYPDINFQIDGNQPSATSSVGYSTASQNSAPVPEVSFHSFGATSGFHRAYNSTAPAPGTTSAAPSLPNFNFSFGASTSSPFHPRIILPKPTTDSDEGGTDPHPPIAASLKPTNDIDRSVATSPTLPPIPSAPFASLPPPAATALPTSAPKPTSVAEQTAKPQEPTPLAKEKGKSCWMPFNSEEEALQWARKLPHGEAGRLMSALTTEGMETHPPPVAPFLKWSPLEAQVIRDDRHNDAAGIQRPRNEPADENSMKSVFESLPTDWQASLKASIEDSREFAGFQVGMISSAALESQLVYLQRWLLTLVNHYQRNLELSANMTKQIAAVENGLQFRQRDIDIIAIIIYSRQQENCRG